MTRISAGIRAKELCDAHVIKERIEVLRVPNNIKNGIAVIDLNKIPKEFKLGTGHVKFFENKLKYVFNRYNELTEEVKDKMKSTVLPYTKENHNNKTLAVFGSLISIRTESIKTALTKLKQEETV